MRWIFLVLIVSAVVVTVRFGSRSERVALAALLASYLGTYVSLYFLGDGNWLSVNWGVWLSDAAAFALLLALVARTDRWWPLPIAGLQLLPLFTPIMAMAGENLISDGLGRAQGLWAYPQLLLLIGANWARVASPTLPASSQA